MIVRAQIGTLWVRTTLVRTLIAIIVVVGVGIGVRVGMHPSLHDCAGIFVAVLESRRVRAAEHDPEDHKQSQHEGPH